MLPLGALTLVRAEHVFSVSRLKLSFNPKPETLLKHQPEIQKLKQP